MRIRPLLTAALVLLVLVGCQPAAPTPFPAPATSAPTATPSGLPPTEAPTDEPQPTPQPIQAAVDLGPPPRTLDPGQVLTRDDTATDLVENLFIGLTRLDPRTGEVTPWLAREWEPAGEVWTFFLRDDVFWVQADPATGVVEQVRAVTADDLVYALARVCSGPSDQPGLQAALYIAGCEEASSQPGITPEEAEALIGARVLNDVAVEIRTAGEVAFLPELLAMPVFRPVPRDVINEHGADWTLSENIVTSGAYALQSAADDTLTLAANPLWPIEREGSATLITVSFTGDWQSDQYALAVAPPGEVPDAPNTVLLARPAIGALALSYDTFPMGKPGVRQALALAVDRQRLIDEVLAPAGVAALPATSIVPPGVPGWQAANAPALDTDPDAARIALGEAGHPECILIPNTTLLTDQTELSRLLAENIVAQWQEVFGCPQDLLRVEQVPPANLLIAQRDPVVRQFQPSRAAVVMLYWQGDYAAPYHYFADVLGCSELFPFAYLDAARECTEADEDTLDLLTRENRDNLLEDIAEGYFGPGGEMPVVPLFTYARVVVVNGISAGGPEVAGPLQFDRWVIEE